MNEQVKKLSILGAVVIVLLGILIYTLPQDTDKKTEQKNTLQASETTVKNFYDWYRTENGNILEDTKTLAEMAKEKGFVTPEFVTSTIQHPLITSKKADVFVCASKKDEKAFPHTFVPFPMANATNTIRVEAISSIPNHKIDILFNTEKERILSITCPVISNLE